MPMTYSDKVAVIATCVGIALWTAVTIAGHWIGAIMLGLLVPGALYRVMLEARADQA